MTERVKRMKEALKISKYPLCVENFRLANESLDATGGEPMVLRRAKLHAHVLDNMPIFIEPEDLLCGSGASKPFGMEMQYEYGVWTKDEVESLKSEIYTIDPQDEELLYQLNERFAGNCLNSNLIGEMSKCLGMDDRLWPFMKSGTILPPWKDRKSGDILADASLSPDHGKDVCGPIAVFQSAMKVNQDPYQGTLMNMKVHPTAIRSDADLMKLGAMVKTYLTHGGKHIQFNVVDRKVMEDAKIHPENHSDLIVRVAGYSAYFTRLPASIQDEVINRSQQEL